MGTLRARLLVGTAIGTGLVLSVSAGALYALIRTRQWAQFDESLQTKARSLAALVEQDGGMVELEPHEDRLPEFTPSASAEYFQLWSSDGAVVAKSASLKEAELPRLRCDRDASVFQNESLPDGRPGRMVAIAFMPGQEEADDPEDEHAGRPAAPIEVTLAVARDTLDIDRALGQLAGLLVFGCAAAIVASVGVLSWFVRRGLMPMDRVAGEIAGIHAADLSARLAADGVPGELAPIVHRLNALLARLEAAFAREKAFTADVAHELRTPLAGLRTTMEVSLAKTRDAADHRRALAESLTIAEQMQQMIENLLELARAEAGQLHVAQDDVDLVPLLRDRFTPFDQRAQQRRLRVQWSLPPSCHARADRTKIALVLSNIFDNATTHADAPGEVRIELKSENGAARLRVSNPASRLSPGDAEHVFQRYWRGDAARSTIDHQHHHGLGLPLCKQLVHLMGGDIEVGIAEEGEFEVSVTLPREVSVTLPRNEPRSSTSDTP